MIYTAALTITTALILGVVYAAAWGLLMEHIRISTEPKDDSRYDIEEQASTPQHPAEGGSQAAGPMFPAEEAAE